MKKAFGIITVSLCAAIILLSSCGGGSHKIETSHKPAASYATDGHYEVNFYYACDGPQPDNEMVEAEINNYLRETIGANITLNLTAFDWRSYTTQMHVMIESRQYFDLCFATKWALDYDIYIKSGAYLDWGPYLDQVPEYIQMMGDLLELSKYQGRNFLMPTKKEIAETKGLLYNKTKAEQYDLDLSGIKNMDDLEDVLREFHEAEPDSTALISINSAIFEVMGIMTTGMQYLNYDSYFLKDGKYVVSCEQPEYLELIRYLRRWRDLGYIPESQLTTPSADIMNSGDFLLWITSLKPGFAEERNPLAAINGYEFGTVDLTVPIISRSTILGSVTALSSTSKNPEKAVYLFELLATDKYLNNLINFGIENIHYVKTEENRIKPAENTQYWPNVPYFFGNRTLDYLVGNEPDNLFELYDDFNSKAITAEAYWYSILYDYEEDPGWVDISAISSAVKAITERYKYPIYCGMVDERGFDEFVSSLKAAGLYALRDEAQRRYDWWLSIQ